MLYFSFDVESVGLYGEGFAVGYCVSDGEKEIEAGIFNCPDYEAAGDFRNREWVKENVLSTLPAPNCFNPQKVRYEFWEVIQRWKKQDAIFVVDCGYPVEARFLMDCVSGKEYYIFNSDAEDENGIASKIKEIRFSCPYPLHEVGTALLLAGKEPLANYERLPNEMPKHNPLADARQSLRLFLKCKDYLETTQEDFYLFLD